MKSIKPGRGPSSMSFIGSLFAIGFGIIWTIAAIAITQSARQAFLFFDGPHPADIAGIVMPLFGLLFIGVGVVNAIYSYKNATGKNRFSIVDIVDKQEEGDPADAWIHKEVAEEASSTTPDHHPLAAKYCTNCGHALEKEYAYCPGCGTPVQ